LFITPPTVFFGRVMPAKKKTVKKAAKKKAVKKTPPVNLITEIDKINNAGNKQPGLDLVNAAVKTLEAHIAKTPADAKPTRAAVRALKGTLKEFKGDKDSNYKTAEARRLAGLVSNFLRLDTGKKTTKLKCGAKSLAEHRTAIAFKDRVNKANEKNNLEWLREDLIELVEKIPSLSTTGVKIKKDLETSFDKAEKAGKKFSKKVYLFTKTYFNAGKDSKTDVVIKKKNKNYVARSANELRKDLKK